MKTEKNGIIIGKNNLPLVNEGDAFFHIACFEKIEFVESQLEEFMDMGQSPWNLYEARKSEQDLEKT